MLLQYLSHMSEMVSWRTGTQQVNSQGITFTAGAETNSKVEGFFHLIRPVLHILFKSLLPLTYRCILILTNFEQQDVHTRTAFM